MAQSAMEAVEATHDRSQCLQPPGLAVVEDNAVVVTRLKPSAMLDMEPFGERHLATQAIEFRTQLFGECDEIGNDHFRGL